MLNNPIFILFSVLVFFTFLLLVQFGVLFWREKHSKEAKKLATRLDSINHISHYEKEISILRKRFQDSESPIVKVAQKFIDLRNLDLVLLQSGKSWSVEDFGRHTLIFFAGSFCLSLLAGTGLFLSLILGLLICLCPLIYILKERTQRLEKIEYQLPEAIESMARSLKAGHSFQSAFKIVGEEFSEPLACEFRTTLEESNLGIPLNEAMLNLSKRVPITDLKFFVIAIMIQRESGGNLANVLTSMGQIIRERFQLMREIKTLSAEGRMSGIVMWVMPILIIPMMSVMTPYYSELLFHTDAGLFMLQAGGVLMLFAGLTMRKIVNIKV